MSAVVAYLFILPVEFVQLRFLTFAMLYCAFRRSFRDCNTYLSCFVPPVLMNSIFFIYRYTFTRVLACFTFYILGLGTTLAAIVYCYWRVVHWSV